MTNETMRMAPATWGALALATAGVAEVAREVAGEQSDWRPWLAGAVLAACLVSACWAALALSRRRGDPRTGAVAKLVLPALAVADLAIAAWTGQWGFVAIGGILAYLTAGVLLSAALGV